MADLDTNDREPTDSAMERLVWFWVRTSIIALFSITLIANIVIDGLVAAYDGATTSLMLGGIVGTSLGINEFVRGARK